MSASFLAAACCFPPAVAVCAASCADQALPLSPSEDEGQEGENPIMEEEEGDEDEDVCFLSLPTLLCVFVLLWLWWLALLAAAGGRRCGG